MGLAVGIYVMVVARGARAAAQAARAMARRRNLIEELESASQKVHQVGTFIQQNEWLAVRMRTEEIQAACRVTLTRWPDQLSLERRNEVITASKLMSSVALVVAGAVREQLSAQQLQQIADAHIRASGHISSALGEARKEEERNGETHNGN